jgi:hypothetical protein
MSIESPRGVRRRCSHASSVSKSLVAAALALVATGCAAKVADGPPSCAGESLYVQVVADGQEFTLDRGVKVGAQVPFATFINFDGAIPNVIDITASGAGNLFLDLNGQTDGKPGSLKMFNVFYGSPQGDDSVWDQGADIEITTFGAVDQVVEGTFTTSSPAQDGPAKSVQGRFRVCRQADVHDV